MWQAAALAFTEKDQVSANSEASGSNSLHLYTGGEPLVGQPSQKGSRGLPRPAFLAIGVSL